MSRAGASTIELLGVHHVGIVVEQLDVALAHYQQVLGAHLELRRELTEQQVEAASLLVGADTVELIAPLDEGSGVARFLQRRGPGLHHVAYAVRDVAATLAAFAASGARLIDERPRPGLHGTPVAFVHPKSLFGVLTELVEIPHGASAGDEFTNEEVGRDG